jgi:murein DD-endopeptidase MepM/ murein hydrolase activator NlpD
VLLGVGSALTEASDSTGPIGKASKSWSVRWQPSRPVNGSPILLQVIPTKQLESLSGKWFDHEVFFSFDPRSKAWFGIAGVSVETHPGKYVLALEGKDNAGKTLSFQRSIAVGKARYRRIAVSVPKQFTEPSPEQLQEIKEEQTLKHDVFSRETPQREWSGQFLAPVKAPVSGVFGTTRTFNGQVQSIHQGLDYGVPAGTPVAAVNRGTVILARPLFFEGNCVVLDHGQGLLTIYMHLSKIEVKEGDEVTRQQEIALSGGSGRATGPHLHMAVRWQGIYLDPATLLSFRLP